MNKDFVSIREFAQRYELSERTLRSWCANGKIEGAFLVGKTWNIPSNASIPISKKAKCSPSPLLQILKEEKEHRIKGGIYHRTQIDMTYNSNHIEGSRKRALTIF